MHDSIISMSYDGVYLSGTISFAASFIALLLACVLAAKDRRSFANRSFIACLAILAVEELMRGMSFRADNMQDAFLLQKTCIAISALLPGTFLIFSLSFGSASWKQQLNKWKYALAASYALPIATLVFLLKSLSGEAISPEHLAAKIIPLGLSGKIFYGIFLISATCILASMERTLRSSIGRIRWQIKFIALGTGCICAVWIYISSQVLIYSVLDLSLAILNPAVLIIANLLFSWGLWRSRFLRVDVYMSHTTIHYSISAFIVSGYLVIMGLMAYIVRLSDSKRPLHIDALLVLIALTGLAILILSDRLQERLKRFIVQQFRRPAYDYRKKWMELTERTNSLVDVGELCTAVAHIISKTFGILSVNIWIYDEADGRLSLSGSTVFTRAQAQDLDRRGDKVTDLLFSLKKGSALLDFRMNRPDWAEDIMKAEPDYFRDFSMRHAVALRAEEQIVGLITLNEDRVGNAPISIEDRDLLHAYGAHLAARILQIRMSDRLRRAREIEAFQYASAFFVHDLKNLASRLSLTMQNLPAYFDNPEFRSDALKLIGESVAKIDETCGRLSCLWHKIADWQANGYLHVIGRRRRVDGGRLRARRARRARTRCADARGHRRAFAILRHVAKPGRQHGARRSQNWLCRFRPTGCAISFDRRCHAGGHRTPLGVSRRR